MSYFILSVGGGKGSRDCGLGKNSGWRMCGENVILPEVPAALVLAKIHREKQNDSVNKH